MRISSIIFFSMMFIFVGVRADQSFQSQRNLYRVRHNTQSKRRRVQMTTTKDPKRRQFIMHEQVKADKQWRSKKQHLQKRYRQSLTH